MTANNPRFPLAIAALLCLLLQRTAEATLAEAKSFDEKVANAASIVVGRCIAKESRWDEARRWILTDHRFQIEKALKGLPVRELTIVTPGGTVGDIQQDAVGVPKFEVGDERVLFVRNTAAGPTVLYFEQGAYRLVREDNERMVVPTVSSAVLIDAQAGKAVLPEEPRTLREFEGRVRDSIQRREAMRMEMLRRQKEEASMLRVMQRNLPLVILALVGAVLATWQLVRRW